MQLDIDEFYKHKTGYEKVAKQRADRQKEIKGKNAKDTKFINLSKDELLKNKQMAKDISENCIIL